MVLYGGIPCNLAPAHFTVHVVQVRLNFALGFAREANPLFETGFSPGCPFFSAQTRREGEWGKPKQRQIWIDFLPLFLIVLAGVKEKTETEKDAAKGMDLRCRIRLHDKP